MSQIASRQIAIATVIEACKRRQLLGTHQARYPIYRISDLFWIAREQFAGVAVLTPDALFLIRTRKLQHTRATTALDLAPCPEPLLEMKHADVPSIIREDAAWPKDVPEDADVAILLRDQLESVFGQNAEIEFASSTTPVRVCCGRGDEQAVRERLHNTGWIRQAPASSTEIARKERPMRDHRPMVFGALCVLILAAIVVITRVDAIRPTMAMVLCIPLLAMGVVAGVKLLAPRPRHDESEGYFADPD